MEQLSADLRDSGADLDDEGQNDPKLATTTIVRDNLTYVLTDLSENDYQEYYNGFANRVLWPILHYRLDLAEFTRRDLTGYMRVNAHFASELSKLIRRAECL